jgi:hypothetical protein
VAYVRFASVCRNFRESKDFEAVLNELSEEEKAPETMTCSRPICGAADALMCNP